MSSMALAAPLTVGFSQVGSESGWRAAETNVAKSEAEKRGITLKIADGQQKQENQIKAVRSFVAQGVDAIFIAPVVATGWEPVLKEAKDAEIPVFLLDRSIDVKDKSLYMTTVTADNILEGKLIGDWLVKEVNGKPCNVVELQGTVGASVAIDRKKGFAEAIKNAPNIKIIRSQSGDFTRSKGKEVMESFIKAENNGKNICMVYAHNDDMVIGAIQAIKEAGLKPGKDILTGSIDGVPDIYKAMIDGEANATLDNVDFSLRRGEIMALLGENGAGKSTLIKALTGVYHADRGTIWLEDQAISPKNTAHAQQLGIGTVYQEVNLLPNMSVADNLFIGREPKRFGLLRRKEMEKRATELMASYGFSLDVREPLNRFSVAMQQIVAICRAIDLSAKVLILDEPTASLDTQEVELLFGLMRQLRDRGVSLIFVTHFIDQVYQVSDRITVLRNGSFVGCRETRELPQIELVKMMLGRELDTHALQRAGRTLLSDKPVAAFKNYGKKGTIAPFDLEVRPGEIVGLAGLLGSGRTETAEVIFGIKPADSGTVLIKGKPQTLRSPHQASVLGIGFCPEDRKTDGIIAAASVRENIILALQAQRGWLRPISRKEQQEIAERFIRQLGIRTPSTEQPIEFLSGGNQQKVLLSRWLLTRPQFLILDEPTRGIDVGAHAEIIRLIETLCADGLALLVISSELEELVGYADRVIIMRDRKQVAEIPLAELSVPAIMNAIAA
ncbi:ABC tran and Peripla BP 4 domain containing prote in [Trichuris trichiura]|uniref:ABC tran and Peripla BP 4 domain containing prote in n=36 Tax=root TaxID=1 RepID=A0A077ZHH8_TRITR|nr:ABC tran and Peripla BP 4 domain containing prote in [Trichuris trichiura]